MSSPKPSQPSDAALFVQKLQDAGVGKSGQLDAILKISIEEMVSIESLLLKSGVVDEAQLIKFLADHCRIEQISKDQFIDVDQGLADQLGQSFLKRHNILPVKSNDQRTSLLTAEPLHQTALELVRFVLDQELPLVLGTKSRIALLLEQHFPDEIIQQDALPEDEDALRQFANEGPVVSFVQSALTLAIQQKASDIHFEAAKNGFKTRFRINGQLSEPNLKADVTEEAVVSRLKYLAHLNISERRKPQDGRIAFNYGGREVDLRLSILPTQYGQSAVIRILDQTQIPLEWGALGFAKEDADEIIEAISQPNGLFLVTGPTGSGKTTTLYTALNTLNSPDRKVFTIEDPIEYKLTGVNQVQVNPNVGLTFATALRSILRQDPNIILVGEIRDAETAEMACRAALVGRMVLSTLHTNSASQARTRLLDLGVAEYLIDATLKGVLGQRLDIRACADCDGNGCETCDQKGVGDRKLSYDLLV